MLLTAITTLIPNSRQRQGPLFSSHNKTIEQDLSKYNFKEAFFKHLLHGEGFHMLIKVLDYSSVPPRSNEMKMTFQARDVLLLQIGGKSVL